MSLAADLRIPETRSSFYDGEPMPWKMDDKPTSSTTPSSPPPRKEIITWVWALPLATAKLGGGAPVSYHYHTSIFTIFLSSILLVVS